MVLGEALPECGGFFDQIRIVSGLRPEQGGFQGTFVAQTLGAAKAFDLFLMDSEDFDLGEELAHSASFL
jgi:hypothetical protein